MPLYNTFSNVNDTIEYIGERYCGLFSIDTFEYIPDKSYAPVPDGKKICSILKDLRGNLIDENELGIKQTECNHEGNCPGTCLMCDAELDEINNCIVTSYHRTIRTMGKYEWELRFKLNRPCPTIPEAGIPDDSGSDDWSF